MLYLFFFIVLHFIFQSFETHHEVDYLYDIERFYILICIFIYLIIIFTHINLKKITYTNLNIFNQIYFYIPYGLLFLRTEFLKISF